MKSLKFYVDTNIYLNLWKKEGDPTKGIPYWKLAQDFLNKAEKEKSTIINSGLILKELYYVLSRQQFNQKVELLKASYQRVIVAQEDYTLARVLESKHKFRISFYDCLHLAICSRLNLILVTRDTLLLEVAKREHVPCARPEDFL